jgi:hypothetical protein
MSRKRGRAIAALAPVVLCAALLAPACDSTRPDDSTRRDEPDPEPDPEPAKLVRDGFPGPYENTLLSPNFAMKWGETGDVNEENLTAILEALEVSFARQVGDMGYPAPLGMDQYRMNIYVSGTGLAGISDAPGYAYADKDPEGFPVIVFSLDRVTAAQLDKSLNSTAHEFFHTVQMATGSYSFLPSETLGLSDWWWEATATWMAEELFPETFADGYLASVASYAFLPHISLRAYETPTQEWELVQGHQYGAFMFARFLSEHVLGPDVIRDSWLAADGEPDVLVVLDRLLSEQGLTVADAFGSFAAHNAVWDYAGRAAYLSALDIMALYYAEDDHRVVAIVPPEGMVESEAPTATLPQHAGYNVISMPNPLLDPVEVRFFGAPRGDADSPASFVVTVVVDHQGSYQYLPLPLIDGAGSISVPATPVDTLHLVVAAWAMSADPNEVFSYRYAMQAP